MWDLGHCNKKKCTGSRLARLGLIEELRLGVTFPGIILSPNGKSCVSRQDAELIADKGIAVVDCSWNRLEDVPFGTSPRILTTCVPDLICPGTVSAAFLTSFDSLCALLCASHDLTNQTQGKSGELRRDCCPGYWQQIQ